MAEVELRTIRLRSYQPILRASEKKFRPYVLAAGQALLQWNILNEEMGSVFLSLMFEGYSVQKAAVWSSVASDRGKRGLLLAAADNQRRWLTDPPEGALARQEKIRARVHELCGLADKLENKRNNIAHAPLYIGAGTPDVLPDTSLKNNRATALEKALGNRGLLREFRYCRDFAVILGDFARAIDRATHSVSAPLPRKPSPPNRGGQKTPRSNPPRPDAKRSRPPR